MIIFVQDFLQMGWFNHQLQLDFYGLKIMVGPRDRQFDHVSFPMTFFGMLLFYVNFSII